jgi:hypothetical protein
VALSPRANCSSSFILTKAEWTTFQTHCYSENLLATGIEPGTSLLTASNSDHYTSEAVDDLTSLWRNDLIDGFT